jgi:hypothetical protein
VAADKVHCNKPLNKRQLSIVENSLDKTREILATVLTTELTVFANNTVMLVTVWTFNILLVTHTPTCFCNGLLALLVCVEVHRHINDVVEF